ALATGSAAHPGRRRAVGCARSESVRIQASGWIDRARCRWRMTVRRCPDSSEFPALVIFSAEELFGFGRITNAHLLRVPLDAFAGAIGDVAQMVRFGEQTTITEWTRRRRARLAGTQPFRMMADRVGDRLRRMLEVGERLFRQQHMLAVVGEQHPLRANEERAIAPRRDFVLLPQFGLHRAL